MLYLEKNSLKTILLTDLGCNTNNVGIISIRSQHFFTGTWIFSINLKQITGGKHGDKKHSSAIW